MTAWQDQAECAGMPTRWWFPEEHDNTATRAKAICAECPVRGACYTAAIANGEQYGIWGGVNFSKGARSRNRNDTRGIMGVQHKTSPAVALTTHRALDGSPDERTDHP